MQYKTGEEYILALAEELKYLSPKDATKVLEYYRNKISVAVDYGEKEEDVVNHLPSIEEVAKDAYASHGIKYLELRKKQIKRKAIFQGILDVILSIIVLFGGLFIIYLFINNIIKLIKLFGIVLTSGEAYEIITTGIGSIAYIFLLIFILIYIIDLFKIIISFLSRSFIKLKDSDKQRKLMDFTISGWIDEKVKKPKVILKGLISSLVIMVVMFTASFVGDGYLKHSLLDQASNEEIITYNETPTNLIINANSSLISLHESTDNQISITHHYEFKHDITTNIDNDTFTLNIPTSNKFDLIELLNEPTQTFDIYIPTSIKNVSFSSSAVSLQVYSGQYDSINLEADEIEVSMLDANVNNLVVKGISVKCGLTSTTINHFDYISKKGSFITKDHSNISSLTMSNSSGSININDTTIDSLELDNNAGSIEINNISGHIFNITSRASINNITNIIYDIIGGTILNTCKLTMSNVVCTTYSMSLKAGSYLIIDQACVQKMYLPSSESYIFVDGLGQDVVIDNQTHKASLCELEITNEGSSSKVELGDSKISNITANINNGYFLVSDCFINSGNITLDRVNIAEFTNNTGDKIFMYITNISNEISFTSDTPSTLVYKVLRWDAMTYANMTTNDNVNVDKSEATDK